MVGEKIEFLIEDFFKAEIYEGVDDGTAELSRCELS